MMKEIQNPHDVFFKEVFSREESARDFILNYLPQEVTELLDMTSLKLSKGSFVDEELKQYHSDILYRAHLRQGDEVCVYFLFEHKSYSEPLVMFHLLRYMVKIWTLAVKNEMPLMPIIPIVLYHGTDKWNIGQDFHSLIPSMPDAFKDYVPNFKNVFYNPGKYEDNEIKGTVILKIALLLMKYIFDERLRHKLPDILMLLEELKEKGTAIEYLGVILKYLTSGAKDLSKEDAFNVVPKNLFNKGGEIVGTLVEQWYNEGEVKGEVKTSQKVIIEFLEIRFQSVPSSLVDKIGKISDLKTLEGLRKKVYNVHSVAEFEDMVH